MEHQKQAVIVDDIHMLRDRQETYGITVRALGPISWVEAHGLKRQWDIDVATIVRSTTRGLGAVLGLTEEEHRRLVARARYVMALAKRPEIVAKTV